MRLDLLKALEAERAARRAAVLVTALTGGAQRLVRAVDVDSDPLAESLESHLRMGRSGAIEVDGARYFLTVQAPPVRLFVVGAVHIAQALAPMARLAGLDMTIIDPRTAFASPERFPDVALVPLWPDEALRATLLDRYSAIALLTHDPKIDDPALIAALNAECAYIGALGSRKTHARRLERMGALGYGPAALARIHAPIGLDIGAVTPAEIAVSILGEIIAGMRKKPLRADKPAETQKVA